jgi:hypothetical protein
MMSKGHSKEFSTFWALKKSDLDEVTEVMFWVRDWAWELIMFLLDNLKNDFGEFDEMMFQGVQRPCELISCMLGIS